MAVLTLQPVRNHVELALVQQLEQSLGRSTTEFGFGWAKRLGDLGRIDAGYPYRAIAQLERVAVNYACRGITASTGCELGGNNLSRPKWADRSDQPGVEKRARQEKHRHGQESHPDISPLGLEGRRAPIRLEAFGGH